MERIFSGHEMIYDGLAGLFGEQLVQSDWKDFLPPERIPMTKNHNPWYYIPHTVKSGELLRFLRSKFTRKYRETPRVPLRQVPKVIKFADEPILYERTVEAPRVPRMYPPMLVVDASKGFDMYTRPINIRESTGEFRTANYDERREVNDQTRYLKRSSSQFPEYFWPNEEEFDFVGIKHRSPRGFQLQYDYQGDVSMAIRDHWEKRADEHKDRKDPHNFDKYNLFSREYENANDVNKAAGQSVRQQQQEQKRQQELASEATMQRRMNQDISDKEISDLFTSVGRYYAQRQQPRDTDKLKEQIRTGQQNL